MKQGIFSITIAVIAITACSKNTGYSGSIMDISSYIRIINSNGQNLLNPLTPNCFKKNEIKLYYLINGTKKEVLDQNRDYPRNFMVYQVESQSQHLPGEYLIRVFMNDKINNGSAMTTTYIAWNDTDTDTIVCQMRKSEASIFCEKVWYNGIVKWDIISKPKVEDKNFPGRFYQINK